MKKSIILFIFTQILFLNNNQAQSFRYWPVLDLWTSEAEKAYAKKDYKKCVVEYDSIIAHYQKFRYYDALINQATCAALGGDTARAFASIKIAINKGYNEVHHLTGTEDFSALYGFPKWQELVAQCQQNKDRYTKRQNIELPEVRDELLKMYDESQKNQRLNYYHQNYGIFQEYSPEFLMKYKEETFKNQFARLIEMSKANGGIVFGKSKVGLDGAQIMIIIIQNANHDPATQDAFAEAVEQSDKGEFQEGDVAILLDKRLYHAGKPQRYGTSYIFNSDEGKPTEMIIVEDPANLNKRREAIGLEPLNEAWFAH